MKKQTAVDWVTIEILDLYYHIKEFDINNREHRKLIMNALKRAKQIEKEQIKKVWDDGVISATYGKPITFEQYYEQTYGGDNK